MKSGVIYAGMFIGMTVLSGKEWQMNDYKWQRVTGIDLDKKKNRRYIQNKEILNSKDFKTACKKVGIKPTKRQASKYRRKKGLAYWQGEIKK